MSRQLGISRNAAKKHLRMDEAVISRQQENWEQRKRLNLHRAYIVHLLQTSPGLSAVKVQRKLRAKHPDLAVSDRSARRYIKRPRERISRRQHRVYKPVLKLEPGLQCQVDGGELRGVAVGGLETTIYLLAGGPRNASAIRPSWWCCMSSIGSWS
jgi:transposase